MEKEPQTESKFERASRLIAEHSTYGKPSMIIDRIKTLTADELQTLFMMMTKDDMQMIVNALRALVGDTESLHKLQRLHVSIEQGIHKLLKVAGQEYDYSELVSRFFRPVDGFANGKRFVEVRLNDQSQFEVISHFTGGRTMINTDEVTFDFIRKQVAAGLWEELEWPGLDEVESASTFEVLP